VLVITKSDAGVGLAPEHPDDVLEPFVTSERDGNFGASTETSREAVRRAQLRERALCGLRRTAEAPSASVRG
jgi:hypothetical protein